jgi:hypothetical protein
LVKFRATKKNAKSMILFGCPESSLFFERGFVFALVLLMSTDLFKTVFQNYALFYPKLRTGIRMIGEHGRYIYNQKHLIVTKESQFGVD